MQKLSYEIPQQCFMYIVTGWPFVDLKNGRLAKQVLIFLRLAGNVAGMVRAGLLKRNFKYETKSKIQMEW